MTTEELERLKKSIEEQGLEYHITDMDKDQVIMIIQKKDSWEGVEFIEKKEKGDMWVRKVLQPILPHHNAINFQMLSDEKTDGCGYVHKEFVKPSTEALYIEQLKKTAYEKFGQIVVGNRFEKLVTDEGREIVRICINPTYVYHKEMDRLWFAGILLYQQGKWAKRIEKVEVDVPFANYHKGMKRLTVNFDISSHEIDRRKEVDEISKFLAQQLENYLNNEQGS